MKRITALLLTLLFVMGGVLIPSVAEDGIFEEKAPALTTEGGEEGDVPEGPPVSEKGDVPEEPGDPEENPEEVPEAPESPAPEEKPDEPEGEPEEPETPEVPAEKPEAPETPDGEADLTGQGEGTDGEPEPVPPAGTPADAPPVQPGDAPAGDSAPAQPEKFAEGYVLLKKDALICSEMNPKKQIGKVAEDAYAWAKLEDDAKDPAQSWLSLTFDTKIAREKGDPLQHGYVQAGQVTVLADNEAEELEKKLEKDGKAREYKEHKIPLIALFGIQPDLNAGPDPEVYCTPAVLKIRIGETARFYTSVKNAEGELSYQWQRSADEGQTWTDVEGETQSMLAFEVTEENKDYLFRCVIRMDGARFTAPVVRLNTVAAEGTVAANDTESNGKPGIKISPKMVRTNVGTPVSFTATVQNPLGEVTYQWQYSTNKGKSWKNAEYPGSNTSVMTVTITPVIAKKYSFRCVAVTGGKKLASKASSVFAVKASASSSFVKIGKNVKFTASAYNYGKQVSYQWYVSKNGGKSWKKYKGKDAKKRKITVKTERKNIGYQYRCKITSSNGKLYTNAVRMPKRRLAVVISNYDYRNLRDLPGVYNDGYTMANLLKKLRWDVMLVKNATAAGMDSKIRSMFSNSREEDVCLVYYSGHGDNSTGGSAGSLCGVDCSGSGGDLYHPAALRNTLLSCTKGKVIVILDSCGSGAGVYSNSSDAKGFTGGVVNAFKGYLMSNVAANTGELLNNRFAVLAACEYGKTSMDGYIYESNGYLYQGRGGVFTYSLVCSMGGGYPGGSFGGHFSGDDVNGDSKLSLQEAYNGIKSRVNGMNTLLARYGINGRITQQVQMGGSGGTILFEK